MTVPTAPHVGFRSRVIEYLPAIALFFGGLAMWEILVRVLDIQTVLLPKPTEILSTFRVEVGNVLRAGRATLLESVGGFGLGAALGVLVALATSRWAGMRDGLIPFAIAANSAPIVALAPISNQWFGILNPMSKIAVVAIVVFFPVMINTVRGLTEVDESEIELMRSYAASARTIARKVRMPNALPFLFSALKVGAALSVITAIVSEYFGGPRDTLGVYISNNASLGRLPEAWSAVIIGTLIGVGLYVVVVLAERIAMPWHSSMREGVGGS